MKSRKAMFFDPDSTFARIFSIRTIVRLLYNQKFGLRSKDLKPLTTGKMRGLQQCATPRGTFTCLALDHRQNLRRALNPQNPDSVPDSALTDFKLEVTAALAGESTAVLLDPEYSAAQAVAAGAIPKNAGLVVAVESTGYGGEPTARQSQLLPGWSVEKAKRMGASMIKLLVYYHPDAPTAAEIEAFTAQVAEDCQKHDLGLMLEPLSYSLTGGKLTSDEKRYVVVETARRLTPLGVDLLKAEFPLEVADPDQTQWSAACTEVSAAARVPWILLSAAVDFETYLRQVTAACNAGASGIAVGRAVWKEAVEMPPEGRAAFLRDIARPRLARLTALCAALAKPWMDFYPTPRIEANWYREY
jgi:tagatose-1,6-bisphosphate aldolase